MADFHTSIRAFDGVMYLIVILAGGIFVMNEKITPGDLVAYTMYVSTLIATIRRIIEFAEQFQRGLTGIERFLQIMDADIEIFDEPDAVPLENPKGDITFDGVSFEYPDDHNKVFRNFDLHIRPGEKLAIVGPSGGGKTTLCNLIPRFYDVTEGDIKIDGKSIDFAFADGKISFSATTICKELKIVDLLLMIMIIINHRITTETIVSQCAS